MSIIYFDNAATTYKKPNAVIRQTLHFIREGYANAGRSGHFLSLKTADIIYDTREAVCEILHFDNPLHVVFSQNATEALNVAIKTSVPNGVDVLVSTMEHNSVLRPLYALQNQGKITLSFFSHKGNIEENIKNAITNKTKVLVSSLLSNVTGEVIDIRLLSKLREQLGLFVIVDASQMFCHGEINLKKHPVDILCTAGHKGAFGMQGVGVSVYKNIPKKTYLEGGSGIDSFLDRMPDAMPERMEAGTLSAPAIASLYYGLTFIKHYGIEKIKKRLAEYDEIINDALPAIPKLRQLTKGNSGIHSFVFEKQPSSLTARILEKEGVLVRSGFHCAPTIHKIYGTEHTGAVRISLSILNTEREIERFLKILKRM